MPWISQLDRRVFVAFPFILFFYFYIVFIEILKFKFKLCVFSAGFSAVDEERTPKTARSFEIKECFFAHSANGKYIYLWVFIYIEFCVFRSLFAGTGVCI